MKNILVFGATGKAGLQIVRECLKAGHAVTAFTRQEQFPIQHPNLHVSTGTLNSQTAVIQAMSGQEVIVLAVGNRNYDDPTMVVFPLARLVVTALSSTQRLLVVSGSGLLLYDAKTLRRDLPGQPTQLTNQRADHWATYQYISPLDIDWTFLCPPRILDGDADGNYVLSTSYFPADGQPFITAGNIGHYVGQEIIDCQHRQTRVGIATTA